MRQTPSNPATERAREVGRRVHGAPVFCPSNHGATCAMATAAAVRTRRNMMHSLVARHVVETILFTGKTTVAFTGNITNNKHQQHAHTRPQDVRSRLGKDCAWPIPLSVQCPPTAAASLVDHALRCC
jgi:Flp pilus assembly protein TadG